MFGVNEVEVLLGGYVEEKFEMAGVVTEMAEDEDAEADTLGATTRDCLTPGVVDEAALSDGEQLGGGNFDGSMTTVALHRWRDRTQRTTA